MRFTVKVRTQSLHDARVLRRKLAELGAPMSEPTVTWRSPGAFPVSKPIPYGPGLPFAVVIPRGILTIKRNDVVVIRGTEVEGIGIRLDNAVIITPGTGSITLEVNDA